MSDFFILFKLTGSLVRSMVVYVRSEKRSFLTSDNGYKLIGIKHIVLVVHLPVPDRSVRPHGVNLAVDEDLQLLVTVGGEGLQVGLSLCPGVGGEGEDCSLVE